MLRIFLIRHGETEANRAGRYQGTTDHPLSEIGRQQAAEVASDLKEVAFTKVFASPLNRSQETAKIVCPQQAALVIPGFIERNFGVWEDMAYTDIKANYAELYRSWLKAPHNTVIPQAVTLQDHQKEILRGLAAVEQAHQPEKEENFLIAGHGGTNRVILLHYLNMELSGFWRIKQDNCCVNIIEIDKIKNYTTVALVNYTRDIYQTKRYRY